MPDVFVSVVEISDAPVIPAAHHPRVGESAPAPWGRDGGESVEENQTVQDTDSPLPGKLRKGAGTPGAAHSTD
ncbi:hypothetical protein ACFV5G_07685 [Streptomyces sp. NPDC059766]|uniref:hypothetical protein n=1 Tax=Streptomyces sp. NPDC059766 TaxID=3346940 RepID=UPI003658E087